FLSLSHGGFWTFQPCGPFALPFDSRIQANVLCRQVVVGGESRVFHHHDCGWDFVLLGPPWIPLRRRRADDPVYLPHELHCRPVSTLLLLLPATSPSRRNSGCCSAL